MVNNDSSPYVVQADGCTVTLKPELMEVGKLYTFMLAGGWRGVMKLANSTIEFYVEDAEEASKEAGEGF